MTLLNLENGINNIKKITLKFPSKSGVYKMISLKNEILYVGKAKNLAKLLVKKNSQISNEIINNFIYESLN